VTLYHQSVANHLTVESENELIFDVDKSSGYHSLRWTIHYYCKDSVPKAQLIGILNNQTIAIRILDNIRRGGRIH